MKKRNIRIANKNEGSPSKLIKKDKRDCHTSISKKLKNRQFNKKYQEDKDFKLVPKARQFLFISSITEVAYSCEHLFVGAKLANAFNNHVGYGKHIFTVSTKKTSANCIFCHKRRSLVFDFSDYLKVATQVEKFSTFNA